MKRIPVAFVAVALALAGCTSGVPVKPVVTPTSTTQGQVPPGGTSVAFKEVASFSIGELDGKVPTPFTCIASRNVSDLGKLIARGGPQSLGQRGIDFSTSTLVSVYSGAGTSVAVTRVDEYGDHILVSYAVDSDPVLLQQAVIFSPNTHVTIPKTDKPVECAEL
jgi:hypothetical protein